MTKTSTSAEDLFRHNADYCVEAVAHADRVSLSVDSRFWFLAVVAIGAAVGVFSLSAMPQDPTYHHFADNRTMAGIPNFLDVVSNLPFVLLGVFGLMRLSSLDEFPARRSYVVFCAGVILIGIGSTWYHYAPSTPTLFWDRLPMTIAFMALLSLVMSDRVSVRFGDAMLWPLVVTGIASVVYWSWSESQGYGDLRCYALVQLLPVVLIPLMLLLYRGSSLREIWLWGTITAYAIAKTAEYFDQSIYDALDIVSGHTLKHLAAAFAVLCAVLSVSSGAHEERGLPVNVGGDSK